MILTCPECATSYFVAELSIPPQGRMVKCTSCAARWRAFPEPEGAESEAAPAAVEPPAEAPEPEIAPADDIIAVPAKPAKAARKVKAEKTGGKPLALYIAAGVGLVLVVALGALVALRQQVAGMVPGTAPIFAAVGLPVNTLGLVIEGVVSKPTFQAGRPVLSVTGAIRNVRKDSIEAPPIRISLLDKEGVAVAGILAQPLNAKVPPGGKRYFAVTLPDPPAGVHELSIGFDLTAGPAAAEASGHGSPGHGAPAEKAPADAHAALPEPVAAHGPEPVEAQALPAGSPDALTKHD